MIPTVRYFIPCWREPTVVGNTPTAHEIMHAVQSKSGHSYPLWHRPFFILAVLSNLHGQCQFHIDLRQERIDSVTILQQTEIFAVDWDNDPLRVVPLSIMMKAVQLPEPGVYSLHFVCEGEDLANATIHARQ